MSGTNTATLNAGEYRVYDGGNAWEVISSSEVLRVESIKDGRTIRKDDFAEVGSYDRYQQYYGSDVRAFDAVKVTALTNSTTFTISISDGQSGKNLVASEVERIVQPVNVTELAGSRLETLGRIDPIDLTSYAYKGSGVAGVGAYIHTTVVTPAANVNGIEVLSCGIDGYNGSVCFDEAVPATTTPSAAGACLIRTGHYGVYPGMRDMAPQGVVKIPAGMGLYVVVYNQSSGWVTYKEL